MPLYIQNEDEMMADVEEDDVPTPVDSPSTGSLSNDHVVDVGNRVLELIEKHKREIQARMANRGKSYREMLETEGHQGRSEHNQNQIQNPQQQQRNSSISSDSGSASPPGETSSSSTTRGSNTLKESFVEAYLTAVRYSENGSSPQNPPETEARRSVHSIFSDEYYDLPGNHHEEVVNREVSNTASTSGAYVDTRFINELAGNKPRSTSPADSSNRRSNLKVGKDQKSKSESGWSTPTKSSPFKKRSSKNLQVPSLNPVAAIAEECIFLPDEDPVLKEDSSGSDDNDHDGAAHSNHVNNNRVQFNSEVVYAYTHPESRASASHHSPVRPGGRGNVDDDNDTNADDEDEDMDEVEVHIANEADNDPNNDTNSNQIGGRPSQMRSNLSIPTDRSRGSLDRVTGREGVSRRGSQQSPPNNAQSSPASSSSSSSQGEPPQTENGVLAYLKSIATGTYELVEAHFWQLCLIIGVIILIAGIIVMAMEFNNPAASQGASKVKPKLFKYYGPVM